MPYTFTDAELIDLAKLVNPEHRDHPLALKIERLAAEARRRAFVPDDDQMRILVALELIDHGQSQRSEGKLVPVCPMVTTRDHLTLETMGWIRRVEGKLVGGLQVDGYMITGAGLEFVRQRLKS